MCCVILCFSLFHCSWLKFSTLLPSSCASFGVLASSILSAVCWSLNRSAFAYCMWLGYMSVVEQTVIMLLTVPLWAWWFRQWWCRPQQWRGWKSMHIDLAKDCWNKLAFRGWLWTCMDLNPTVSEIAHCFRFPVSMWPSGSLPSMAVPRVLLSCLPLRLGLALEALWEMFPRFEWFHRLQGVKQIGSVV